MKSKVSNIKIVAKNNGEVFYQADMGSTVDIVYKTKDIISKHELFMVASYPDNLARAIGGMASLLGGMFVQKTVAPPSDCDLIDLDILIFSEGSDKPDTPQIKCISAAIIPAVGARMKMNEPVDDIPLDMICIGMDSREAIGAIHMVEFQNLISSGMNGFMQQMAAAQARMMGRGPGPGGQDLRNLLNKPPH